MLRTTRGPSPYTAAWLLLVTALCVVVGLWATHFAGMLGPSVGTVSAASVPVATAAPNIVTDYTSGGTASTESLCAELAPRSATVVVETPDGVILSTLDCPTGITPPGVSGIIPPGGCIFTESPDGGTIVMSEQTGSLLSEAQAANCTK